MYILSNLNQEIKTLEGASIAGIKTGPLTIKQAMISICELHQPTRAGGGESLKSYDIGIRIQKAQDSIEITSEEFEFLKKIIAESVIFVSIIIGRLTDYLNSVEQIKVEKK